MNGAYQTGVDHVTGYALALFSRPRYWTANELVIARAIRLPR